MKDIEIRPGVVAHFHFVIFKLNEYSNSSLILAKFFPKVDEALTHIRAVFGVKFVEWNQGFGTEKDGNCDKFIGSNLVIFCYKEFEKFALCKSFSQSEARFVVYSDPIKSGNVKINFS